MLKVGSYSGTEVACSVYSFIQSMKRAKVKLVCVCVCVTLTRMFY